MEQRQHVISEWLLKAFSRPYGGRSIVTAYDKTTGEYVEHDSSDFLVEVGAHPDAVEAEISRIETPAAQAARSLLKRAKNYPPGLYAIQEQAEDLSASGPAMADAGMYRSSRLLVTQHSIRGPSATEREALARYAGLMYQRAPKTEASMLRWGQAFDRGIQDVLDRELPGAQNPGVTTLAHRRERAVELSPRVGRRLAAGSWFLVRAGEGQAFVLSDSPVIAVAALGPDDEWRAILSKHSLIVLMALSPVFALLLAPQHLVPVFHTEPEDLVRVINRALWRCAERHVLGRTRQDLEAALGPVDQPDRRMSVDPLFDERQAFERARTVARRTLVTARIELPIKQTIHWRNCRVFVGQAPFPAEDRHLLLD